MNEKRKSSISQDRKTTSSAGDDPNQHPEFKKRSKLDSKTTLKFSVKTSNEQNHDFELAVNCTFNDLKSSLTWVPDGCLNQNWLTVFALYTVYNRPYIFT